MKPGSDPRLSRLTMAGFFDGTWGATRASKIFAPMTTDICAFGWKARDFALEGVDGKTYSLGDVRGVPVHRGAPWPRRTGAASAQTPRLAAPPEAASVAAGGRAKTVPRELRRLHRAAFCRSPRARISIRSSPARRWDEPGQAAGCVIR